MTVIQAIRNLLDSDAWTPSISGRPHDVPKPAFVTEKSEIQTRLRTQDVAFVRDGGDEVHTPLGFGWTHETVEWTVVVELRTTGGGDVDGRTRMFGERGGGSLSDNEVGRWPGLAGETERILLDNRKGFEEFDIVGGELRAQDVSGDFGGANYYRVHIVVPLRNVANSIDTSA